MPLTNQAVSIPSGMSLSTSIAITGVNQQLVAIIFPNLWDPAPITFRWSIDNTAWYDIFDRGGHEVSFIWTPNALVPIQSPYGFYAFPYFQIRSGSRAKAVPQSRTSQFTIISQ